MDVDINPGPLTNTVLYAQDSHISKAIWKEPNVEHVKPVHNYNHVPYITHEGVLYYLHLAGFYGLYHLTYVRVDNPLITALIERWRPETHTFHMPIGECTITLQDVEVMAGVRVDGQPLIRSEKNETHNVRRGWVRELLGVEPTPDTFTRDGMISCKWLAQNFDPGTLPANAPDDRVKCITRACILRILASQYLQDMQGTGTQLYYLPFMRDLEQCGQYSWGSAILAFLYRSLCKAASGKVDGVNGALILLQFWAWSRFRPIQPNKLFPAEELPRQQWARYPYGRRWSTCASKYDKGGICHSLRMYRDLFDQLSEDQVIWEPYKNEIIHLPDSCKAGQAIWRARVPLICLEIVEWHYPDRVMRQFGMRQGVPQDARRDDRLHTLSRRGNAAQDWETRHATHITYWEERFQRVVPGDIHEDQQTTTDDYMGWYQRITRRWIGPIIAHPPSRGYHSTAGRIEVLYQGLCTHYQMFMQLGYNDGIQDCLKRFTTLGIKPPKIEQSGVLHQQAPCIVLDSVGLPSQEAPGIPVPGGSRLSTSTSSQHSVPTDSQIFNSAVS